VKETITGAPQAQHNGTIGYVFDKIGNRLQRNSTVAAIPSQVFSYNAGDQMSGETYDLNGNLTSSADGRTYTYDFEDQLKSVTLSGQTVNYSYDGEGSRVARSVASQITQFSYDTNTSNVVEEVVNGQLRNSFTHGHSPLAQRSANGAVSFFQQDAGKHTRSLTNEVGGITDRYDYDAFGIQLGQTGVSVSRYLYRGEEYDEALDGYNLRNRYYRQGVGRFTVFDPLGGYLDEPEGLHRYLYVGADPVNFIDPLGLISTFEYGVASGSHKSKPVPAYHRLGQGIKCVINELAEEVAMGLIASANNDNHKPSESYSEERVEPSIVSDLGSYNGGSLTDSDGLSSFTSNDFAGNSGDVRYTTSEALPNTIVESSAAFTAEDIGSIEGIRGSNSVAGASSSWGRFDIFQASSRRYIRLKEKVEPKPGDMIRPQVHHDLPRKWRKRFKSKGLDIDLPKYTRWVETHGGNHQNWSHAFNKEWEDFFRRNPNPTKDKILDKFSKIRKNPKYPSRPKARRC
jgi:RHS repeat-associated protein